jgi:RNA polymerase-binding transcription factor DksA
MAKKTIRKTAAKKSATKKTAAKKVSAKKAAKKAPAKKVAAKKVAAKKAPAKKAAKKTPAKKVAAKKTPTKKVAAKKAPAKKASIKKVATKKVAAKKTALKKVAAKKAPTKKALVKKVATKKVPAPKKRPQAKAVKAPNKIALKKASVARNDNGKSKSAAIGFTLDEVEAVVAARKTERPEKAKAKQPVKPKVPVKKTIPIDDKPVKKRVHAAASLADILGFNPSEKKKTVSKEANSIPRKWKKYYKLLVELRKHLQDELDLHTADTLMHSSREDSGDLSNYSNHQADAGTDNFDRDFALSVVSSEQDALYEIEDAIRRMQDSTYGVCEQTGDPIKTERLEAVPFARFSLEGQKEYEKNNRRKNERVVSEIFADSGDAPKIISDDDE